MQVYTTSVLADGFVFLEGPRWHDGRLWVSDIMAGRVYAITPDGSREAIVEVPEHPSGLGFLPDGTLLVVSMRDRRLYRVVGGRLHLHADVSRLCAHEINDMVVDARGRAYVGHFGYDLFGGAPAKQAEVILVMPDGSARIVAAGLDFPNGLVITDAGATLVVAESFGHRLRAFDIAPDGGLGNARVLSELPDLVPDGICLDVAGHIWVAGAMGGRFVRVDTGGRVVAEIDVAPRSAIACQLGGDDGRTLYCLTYAGGVEEIAQGKPGARIETARVTAAAAGSP